MKPRTLIAVQFALWAFFFGRIIPFSGDFLLPVVWIYDKKVFVGYLVSHLIDVARFLPGAMEMTFGLPGFTKELDKAPQWILPYFAPLTLAYLGVNVTLLTWLGAWFLKRKMKKLAPDLEVIRRYS